MYVKNFNRRCKAGAPESGSSVCSTLLRVVSFFQGNSRAFLVWLCGSLFYFYQFSLRVAPGAMEKDLMRDFGVQSCSLGILGAFYYVSYAALQVPIGLMLDRVGSHRIIPISIGLCAAGAFLFSFSSGLAEASFARLLMGAGSACAFIGTIKLITLWFSPHRKALIIGLTMALGTVGATFGTAFLPFILTFFEWQFAMLGLGFVGGALALVSFFLIRPHPKELSAKKKRDIEKRNTQGGERSRETLPPSFWEGLRLAVSNPQVWLLALFGCLMYTPIATLADLWGNPFLRTVYQIDQDLAGFYLSAIFWGVCLGGPIVSYFSDRLRRRRPFMVAATLLSTAVYAVVILVPALPAPVMMGCLFLGGFFFGGQVLCFSSITESLPLWASGVSVGFANMIIMSSGIIFEPLVGYLLDSLWDGSKVGCIPLYSVEVFRKALTPILFSLVTAFVVTLFIKETFPGQKKYPSST